MASSVLQIGQRLKGGLSVYTITKQLYPTIWLATNAINRPVIIKCDRPERMKERDLLKRFHDTALFRPLIDEIEVTDLASPAAIVLKHYDCHIGEISKKQGLSSREAKYLGSRVLKALCVLHESGYIHTDVKPDNILVNLSPNNSDDIRFTDVCLADLGDTVSTDSEEATCGYPMGSTVFRSPETTLMMPFTTASDIWSLGTTLISLIYGHGFDLLWPGVDPKHNLFIDKLVRNFHKYFGPFPETYLTLPGMDEDRAEALITIMNEAEARGLFRRASSTEISNEDRDFICSFMKLDYRDRPTAAALLNDKWFAELNASEGAISRDESSSRDTAAHNSVVPGSEQKEL
ncbi:kinase-like domain-containing protein [Nemania sp. FL0916]|nr:kinase-like domain-containing protein [Nemania sp. FL0916]